MASEGSLGQEPASDSSTVPTTETRTTVSPAAPAFTIYGISIDFKPNADCKPTVLLPTETILDVTRIMLEYRHLDGPGADVIVVCDEERMGAHKKVLNRRIPYFTALFAHELIKKSSEVVSFSSQSSPFDSAHIRALLGYAYSGVLTITEDNARGLLAGAHALQMDVVVDACASFLLKRVRCDNALPLLPFFEPLAVHNERLWRFIDANFVPISRSPSFAKLDVGDVIRILQRNSLRIDSEQQVFKAVCGWIEVDNKRCRDGPKLLKHVRLSSLRKSFISRIIGGEDWVKDSPDCDAILSRHKADRAQRRDRFCTDALSIFCIYVPTLGREFHTLNMLTGAYAILDVVRAWAPRGRFSHLIQSVAIGKKAFFIGLDSKTSAVLDVATNEWSQVAAMPAPRAQAAVVAIDSIIYIAGGILIADDDDLGFGPRDRETTSSLISLNLRKHNPVWKERAPMPIARSRAASCAYNGRLYVFGGMSNDGNLLDRSDVYDAESNQWSTVAPMPRPTCGHAAIVVGDVILVAGGETVGEDLRGPREDLATFEEYDPHTDTWRSLPSLPKKIYKPIMVYSSGKVFVMQEDYAAAWMFDMSTSAWTPVGAFETIETDCLFSIALPATIPMPVEAFEMSYHPPVVDEPEK